MSKASDQITVVVQTPLKRDGKRIAPDTELDMTLDEARPLLDVQAVLARDFSDARSNEVPDADGTEGPVNVNTATAEQIADAANGIGLNTARDLVKWREANGPFGKLDELSQVGGIGKATVKRNREALAV